jgi:asparagine synthase (glutamine-hydrolysing)
MCGIAGFKTSIEVKCDVLGKMVNALFHRGPDSAGYFRDDDYSAGVRRLAINDVGGGDQPLYNADRSVVLLYNGEIYNYWNLRRELEAKGYTFRTRSDGEVICHLYDIYQEKLFECLDGMFAAALWIAAERKLLLARDLAGEKPLYYVELSPGEVAFASEIAALKKFPNIDLSLDRQAIWDFPTFLWVPEPETIYKKVKALPPGHILTLTNEFTRLRRYTNRLFREGFEPFNRCGVVAKTRQIVEAAVTSRLLSDVPVGSFLSGGLDSSIVATIAARKLNTLDTFSVGFDDVHDPYHGRSDESEAAALTAARIGSRHHQIRVTAQTLRDELDTFCRHAEQPFGVSSGLGILAVARAAHQIGVKVLLSGDGADEAFGGYSWYLYLDGRGRCGGRHREGVLSFQNFGVPIADRLVTIDATPGPAQAWAWHYYASEEEKKALFCADFPDGLHSSLDHFRAYNDKVAWRPMDFISHDREFYFANEMLRKMDRMTMAYSVEGRVPFAAPAVLAFANELDFPHLVTSDGELKATLRRAFVDILPPEVVARPKHGFNVPIDHWLRGEWSDLVDETFAPGAALYRSGIAAPGAGQVARAMLSNRQRLNGHTVFCMIMLNRWLEMNDYGNYC